MINFRTMTPWRTMTFSILAIDRKTGTMGGAAATGSLCVGGWVLRGDPRSGMSASQGAAPSTFWGEDVLFRMAAGETARTAVGMVTASDSGRAFRQLAALDRDGNTAAFTGSANTPQTGERPFDGGIATGNMLTSDAVLEAMSACFLNTEGPLGRRLLDALSAAREAGGDRRGLLSAALLVTGADRPPLTLRVDFHEHDPIAALRELHHRATTGAYADWTRQVPTLRAPARTLDTD